MMIKPIYKKALLILVLLGVFSIPFFQVSSPTQPIQEQRVVGQNLGAANTTYSATVNSAKVAATLTDYPGYVDLSEMPASFWTTVKDNANTHATDLERSSSQYWSITDANQTGLDGMTNLTLETWVKVESTPGTGVTYSIMGKWGSSGNRSYILNYRESGGTIGLQFVVDGGANSGIIAKTLTPGVWYHIAAVYTQATPSAEIFVNGVSIGSGGGSGGTVDDNATEFRIGNIVDVSQPFDGLIDDVRLWDTNRSVTEIRGNMNKELDGDETGLVGYWKFNNDGNDSTSNGNDLTNNNSATFTTSSAFDTAGSDIRVYSDSALTTELPREVVGVNVTTENTHATDLEASSSQYWSIADSSQTGLDLSGDFTFEGYIKLEQLPSTAATTFPLISKYGGASNRQYLFQITSGNVLQLVVYQDDATRAIIEPSSATFDSNDVGRYVHIAVTFDLSASTGDMYKDGEDLSASNTGHTISSIANTAEDFQLGARTANSFYFDGVIDDVRVWSDIRTANEIYANKDKQLTGSETNLQGYWRFNNDGTDETSNENDLTNNNSATFTTDVPFNQTGEVHTKISSLTTSTVIYIDVDGARNDYATTDTYGAENVWSDYGSVHHLLASNGGELDSTGNANNLADNNTVGTGTGKIGNARDFESTNSEYLSATDDASISLGSSDLTVSGWINAESLGGINFISGKGWDNASASEQEWFMAVDSTPRARFGVKDGSSTISANNTGVTITTGTYFYIVGRVDNTANTVEVRINTTDSSTASFSTTNDGSDSLTIGTGGVSSTAFFDGLVDEHRLRKEYLSDDWLTTEYNNQSDPSTFWTLAEAAGDRRVIIISQATPSPYFPTPYLMREEETELQVKS